MLCFLLRCLLCISFGLWLGATVSLSESAALPLVCSITPTDFDFDTLIFFEWAHFFADLVSLDAFLSFSDSE